MTDKPDKPWDFTYNENEITLSKKPEEKEKKPEEKEITKEKEIKPEEKEIKKEMEQIKEIEKLNNDKIINLIFWINGKQKVPMQCKMNERINDVIHRFEIMMNVGYSSYENFYIWNAKRIERYNCCIKDIFGLDDKESIVVIETRNVCFA